MIFIKMRKCDVIFWRLHKTNVGAGLLAKAVYQATFMSTDNPSSRAGSLPHGLYLTGRCGYQYPR